MIKAQMPNYFGGNSNEPNKIIIHSMGEIIDNDEIDFYAPNWLEQLELSVHAFITPTGVIIRSRSDNQGAWHCKGYNVNSLGVEFLVAGLHTYETFLSAIDKPYISPAQYKAGVSLVKSWVGKFDIEKDRIFKHSFLDPERKYDPGNGFPWTKFINDIYTC